MSTIFKTRISQQEVQTPVVYTSTIATEELNANHLRSETIESPEIWAESLNANKVLAANSLNLETVTDNLTVHNDVDARGDVLVSSGNVLVAKGGTVSFVDDGEVVDENGASGFPVLSGIPYALNNSTIYNIGEIIEDVDLSAIHFSGNDKMVQTCEIWFSIGDEVHDIYWPENMLWLDSTDGNAPAIVVRTEYRVAIRKEANGSMVASIAYALGEGGEIVSSNMMEGVARLDADNTFTAGNTFTGSVDMSGASVTPPEGWNVAELTPEAIQAVVPIAWGTYDKAPTEAGIKGIVYGSNAKCSHYAVALGMNTYAHVGGIAIGRGAATGSTDGCISIGFEAKAQGMLSSAIGIKANAKKANSFTIGAEFTETTDSGNVTHTCITEGTGSITIGAGANTLNNGDTESSNSVTIGCKASNSGADSVVIGASASNTGASAVAIGAGCSSKLGSVMIGTGSADTSSVAIGKGVGSATHGIAIGYSTISTKWAAFAMGYAANANGEYAMALGQSTKAKANNAIAIGHSATVSDYGATAIRSTAEDGTYTQLYFSGANTPLANTYANGEAIMGYVTTDSEGNMVASGFKRLSALFDEGSMTQPAILNEDGEWEQPKVFKPSDVDMEVEEPSESEEYQPLPVYPIVEPELEEI